MEGKADLQQPEGQDLDGYGGDPVAVCLAQHVVRYRQYGKLKHPACRQSFVTHQAWQLRHSTLAKVLSGWQMHESMLHSPASLLVNHHNIIMCKPVQALTSFDGSRCGRQAGEQAASSQLVSVCVGYDVIQHSITLHDMT